MLLVPTVGGALPGLCGPAPARQRHDAIDGLSAGPVQPSAIGGVALAALAPLAFGAVLGPEAP